MLLNHIGKSNKAKLHVKWPWCMKCHIQVQSCSSLSCIINSITFIDPKFMNVHREIEMCIGGDPQWPKCEIYQNKTDYDKHVGIGGRTFEVCSHCTTESYTNIWDKILHWSQRDYAMGESVQWGGSFTLIFPDWDLCVWRWRSCPPLPLKSMEGLPLTSVAAGLGAKGPLLLFIIIRAGILTSASWLSSHVGDYFLLTYIPPGGSILLFFTSYYMESLWAVRSLVCTVVNFVCLSS